MTQALDEQHRPFHITVLGRTLEHLGTQMYKRRDVAIAELVANAWDAGAKQVEIEIPLPEFYSQANSKVVVSDDGLGMSDHEVQSNYLVIGRNRRASGQSVPDGRRPMGRKGVGKLAGFGLGKKMSVITRRDGAETEVTLDGENLTASSGNSETLELPGVVRKIVDDVSPSGTRIELSLLKHKTPPDINALHQSLARRFSRSVLGAMTIKINGEQLRDPQTVLTSREPKEGLEEMQLPCGNKIHWWAGFSEKVLPAEMQGFTILVNGKTAQAPPFFFQVEATASGQHGTKYLTGVIEADYLDNGIDDSSDLVSTDRQDLDWDAEATQSLRVWGENVTRRLLRDRLNEREERAERSALADAALAGRIQRLDPLSKKQATKFIRALGRTDADSVKVQELSNTIIRAFEYRQFHDYIEELDAIGDDPASFLKALDYLKGWRVLESRAVLEVIQGRLEIVDKFFKMIVNDIPETASKLSDDNMHDLLARYPWIINPDWQVLSEEKTITKQLQEWNFEEEGGSADRTRYDFLALTGDGETVVVEIKRSGHAVVLADLHQLEGYVEKLGQARSHIKGVFITGDSYAVLDRTLSSWRGRDDMELLTWGEVQQRTHNHYAHYAALLNSDIDDDSFARKGTEVQATRSVLATSSRRSISERALGIAPPDLSRNHVEGD